MKEPINQNLLKIIRIFSLLAIILLILTVIYNLFFSKNRIDYSMKNFITDFENFLSIILFTLLFIYPQKIEFLSFMSFYYAIESLITNKNDPIGIMMYFLGIVVLNTRGFFLKRKILKLSLIFSLFFLLLLINADFNFIKFYSFALDSFAYILLLCLIIFFAHYTSLKHKSTELKTLNLAEYSSLKESDVQLLEGVLNNKQYKVIAIESEKTEGAIRNRLNRIYDILEVFDKQGFLASYHGCQIVYIPVKTYNQD